MKRTTIIMLLGLGAFALASVTALGQEGPKGVVASETSELLVFLEPGTDAKAYAAARGMVIKRTLRSDPDAHVMAAGNVGQARMLLDTLHTEKASGGIRGVFANGRRQYVLDAFVPNDPYFHKNTPSAGWPGQWHLVNEHTAGLDARVQGAWDRNLTGGGVLIGICDDGLQTTHPDLAPNYVAAHSYDFFDDDANPDPVQTADNHGTAVAGVAAARGANGIGVTGAAPYATLAGLRLPFHVLEQDAADFVDATLYHSSGADTSIKIKNHSYGYSVGYVLTDGEAAALETSTAAGTIHCCSAGNGGDSNLKDLQNQPGAISVSALGSDGRYANYSSYGANVFVTAPSNSDGLFGITTTDRTGEASGYNGTSDTFPDSDYTSDFGGTSSASPLVAGVMALAKQARPQLDTRFAKHLLARTCDIVDATDSTPESDGGWRTNAAGFHFNQRYGFGLIDADELTQLATLYDSPTTLLTQTTGTVAVNQTLADTGSKTVQFTLSTAQPLEEVLVTIDFETTNAYPLEVNLTAPSGYRTRLARGRDLFPSEPHARMAWQYTANALWGENPAGTWTLKIEDTKADGKQVTWHSYKVTARMGTLGLNNCISAPTNVAATDGTQEYTRVTWSAVSGATHYCVYRATSDDFGLAVAIGNWQTGTSYDDTTCLPLTAYYYWVRAASDSIGQCGSLPSNSDMGWSKLRPPTGVSASDGTTTDGVQITWDSAPMATYYRVYRNDVNNPAFAIPISSWQTELSYLDVSTAAVPGVDKYYWVCSAVNSSGGAESWFSAVDTGYRKLSSPAGVQATQGTYSNYVRVTWSAVWGASYYRVYRSSTNDPATAVGIGAWSISTSYNDTTAEPCDSHYYWVRAAVNSGGARPSDVSTAASGYRPMPAPTNVSASDGTYTAYCQVTWDAVSGATHYRVWRSTTNDPATAQQLSSWQMGTSYNHTGQYGQTNYYWITAAKDSSGLCASEKSASDSGWRGLLPPNCVNATDGQYMDRVWIGWCWGQYDIYHKIYRGLTSDPAAATAITGWIDTSFYEDTTGDLGVEYYYFVKAALAADGTGESDYSLGDLGWREIPAPANVAASDGSSTSYVRVTWDSGGAGLWYQVYRGTSSDPKFSTNISAWLDGVTSFDDTTAEAGTTYYYWVAAAADGAGTGASDAGGPDTGWRAIAGPDATASDGTYTNRVAVSWFIAPGSPYYFRVYRASVNNSAQALPLSAWRTGSSYSDTSADPGVYYYYWVKAAMDAAGTNAGPFGRGNRGHRALDCNNNGVPDQNDPDADGDGVPDDCDLCPNTLAGALVDATGCPLPIPGDYDHDGDVDEDDYGTFLMCSFGPAVPRTAGCVDMDFDHDYDVDVNDFGVFQRCYSGRNIAGNPNCAD